MFVVPTMKYGVVRKGREYRVLSEGFDYTLVAALGRPFYVPRWVFDPANLRFADGEEGENDDDRKNYRGRGSKLVGKE
jgi:hypothetical protein